VLESRHIQQLALNTNSSGIIDGAARTG